MIDVTNLHPRKNKDRTSSYVFKVMKHPSGVVTTWPIRLKVRTFGFQPKNLGALPGWATKEVRTTYHTSCTYMVLKRELGD